MPSNPAPLGDAVGYFDRLGVHNRYFAPQVGLSAEAHCGGLSLQAAGKLGLGWLHVSAKAEGSTVERLAEGTVSQLGGGVLSAAGTAGGDRFAVIPELALSAGYQVASWCRLQVGYDLLYASEVVRAAGLVNGVSSAQVPQLPGYDPAVAGAVSPSRPRVDSFWAQGLTAGLELRY